MKKIFLLLSVALVFSFCLQAQNFINISKSDQGKVVKLSTEQVLEINLPCTPSSGYSWCIVNDNKVLMPIEEIGDREFISDRNTTNGKVLVGQSGIQIIRYTGTSQGTADLSLELKRPWEKNGAVLDNFSVTVISEGKYSGIYSAQKKELPKHVTSTSRSVPSKWDWRSRCTPVQNQMSCGDCWAFAGVGAFECNIKIVDGVSRDLSEAYLTNCDTDSDFAGCGGGWCPVNYWMAPRGAVYEADEPWTTSLGNGTTGTCNPPYTYHETIDTFSVVPHEGLLDSIPPDSDMKKCIYNYGPIWVALDGSSGNFSSYSGNNSVFTATGSVTNHAVVLVGWCDSVGVASGGYWILRNSWGPGWGMNGYMYISYGSSLVGTFANYIVYKGGTPHNIPPAANFGAASTSSCTGEIQFMDSSYNEPASWLWNFGDGQTSTLQNPSHTYIADGNYTIKLKTMNTFGNDSLIRTGYITINMPDAPVTTGASHTGPGSVTLSATGSDTLTWYDAASGGNLVNTGTTFVTPVLAASTTYYVENDVHFTTKSVGMASSTLSTSTGGYYTASATQGEIFDALVPLTIKSVSVYANTTASRTITLKNSAGTVIRTLTTSIASGAQTVTLNFDVPAGSGYVLACGPSNSLWREKSGAVYPYAVSNLISITNSTAGSAGYYYYFFNWQVQQQPCTSPRTPVTATITVGLNEFSENNISVFPNPNEGKFTMSFDNSSHEINNISIENSIGQVVSAENITSADYKKTFDLSDLPAGIYYIKLSGTEKIWYDKMVIQ